MSENPEAYRIKRICGIPKKRVGGVIGPTILNGPNLEPDANVISAGIIPEMPGEVDLIGPDKQHSRPHGIRRERELVPMDANPQIGS